MIAIRKYFGDFLAVIALMLISFGVLLYVLISQDARPPLPLIEGTPFVIKAEFSDAQAVVPGQGQTARVAGVEVGKITNVELEEGRAVVSLSLKEEYSHLVHQDASALLRPRTGLKDMFVEIDPGSRDQPLMEENGRIAASNTAPDVDPDEVLSMLDTDTRDYLQLLVNGAGKGLKNNGYDLREVLRRFEPLHRDLARVNTAVAGRRSDLKELIHNYGSLTSELGKNDDDLKRLVTASEAVFRTFAKNDGDVSATFRSIPPALQQTAETLPKVERFGNLLGPTLQSLRPAFRQIDEVNAEIRPFAREATPTIRDQIRPFVRTARPIVRDLRPAAIDLARAQPDLARSFSELNRFFNIGAYNPNGAEGISKGCENGSGCSNAERTRDEGYLFWLAWTAQNSVSLFETSDAQGPFRRATLNLSCESLRALVRQQGQQAPQALSVLGIPPDALVNDQLCGAAAQPSTK